MKAIEDNMRQIKFHGASSPTKDAEIMTFLHERVFDPILNGVYDNKLKQGVRATIMRMEALSTASKVQYFWSAIVGTDKSIRFTENLSDAGAVRFEDVMEEFRTRFNDRWLNG